MKSFFQFFLKTIPFTAGIILTLIATNLLVGDCFWYYEFEFWGFLIFAVIGIPTVVYGIKILSDKKGQNDL